MSNSTKVSLSDMADAIQKLQADERIQELEEIAILEKIRELDTAFSEVRERRQALSVRIRDIVRIMYEETYGPATYTRQAPR